MTKPIYFICFLLCYNIAIGQLSGVKGVVSIHNSLTNTGKKEFVSGAEVADEFDSAQYVVTDMLGQFDLIYFRKPVGTSVHFLVSKASSDLEVVNITDLHAVTGQKEIVHISMAPKGMIADLRKKIYHVGKTAAEKKLDQLIKDLLAEINANRKDSAANSLYIVGLKDRLDLLEKQQKEIENYAADLADRYAQINLDDASPVFKQAFNLFQSGKLDEAMLVLKGIDLNNGVKNVLEERAKVQEMKVELSDRDSLQQARSEQLERSLHLKADLHFVRHEFDSASRCYELIIQLDSNNMADLYRYGTFLESIHDYDRAKKYLFRTIDAAKKYDKPTDILNYANVVAQAQNALGSIYYDEHDFARAETAHELALTLNETIAKTLPARIESEIARTHGLLGTVYLARHDFPRAKQAFLFALGIYQRLAKNGPAAEHYLADIHRLMGDFYLEIADFKKSEHSYMAAMEIYQRSKTEQGDAQDPKMAEMQSCLGNLYLHMNSFAQAEKAYSTSLGIYNRLSTSDSETYQREYLAPTYCALAKLYISMNNYPKAGIVLDSAMKLYHRWGIDDSTKNEDLADFHMALGLFYSENEDYAKARGAYGEAIRIYKNLVDMDPIAYGPDYAVALDNVGQFYVEVNEFSKAEDTLKKALGIYRQLPQNNRNAFGRDIAQIENSLGTLYSLTGDLPKCKAAFLAALEEYQRLSKGLPSAYQDGLARTKYNLAEYYLKVGELPDAESAALSALSGYQQLSQTYPDLYSHWLAKTGQRLGDVYKEKKENVRSETAYVEAYKIYSELSGANKARYQPELISLQDDLGNLYVADNDLRRAETSFLEEVKIAHDSLYVHDDEYKSNMAKAENNLGAFYMKANDFTRAQASFLRSLGIREQLRHEDSTAYEPDLARTQNNLGVLYTYLKKYDSAESFLQSAIAIRERWKKQYPESYKDPWSNSQVNLSELYARMVEDRTLDLGFAGQAHYQGLHVRVVEQIYEVFHYQKVAVQLAAGYDNLAWYQLLNRQYEDAKLSTEKGLRVDSSTNLNKTNLAHLYLIDGDLKKALAIYKKLGPQKNESGVRYYQIFQRDWNALVDAGIGLVNVLKVKALFNR